MQKEKIKKLFKRPPVLETQRLILRKLRIGDYKDMFEYAGRDDVTKYLLWNSHPDADYTFDYLTYVQTQYKTGEFYDFAVVLRENGKMIGTCGFSSFDFANNGAEIGYVINPEYRGNGYADEAVSRIMAFGFTELDLRRIEARYIVNNDSSRRVMEKCGMTFEGIHRSAVLLKGKYADVGYYSILFDEYIEMLLRDSESVKENG